MKKNENWQQLIKIEILKNNKIASIGSVRTLPNKWDTNPNKKGLANWRNNQLKNSQKTNIIIQVNNTSTSLCNN
jgi:hypothetical protein